MRAVLLQLPYVVPKEFAMIKQRGSEALSSLVIKMNLQKEQEELVERCRFMWLGQRYTSGSE